MLDIKDVIDIVVEFVEPKAKRIKICECETNFGWMLYVSDKNDKDFASYLGDTYKSVMIGVQEIVKEIGE
jgi:hypothetical protein